MTPENKIQPTASTNIRLNTKDNNSVVQAAQNAQSPVKKLTLNGVDASVMDYLRRKLWVLLIVVFISVALGVINPVITIIICAGYYLYARNAYAKGLLKAFAAANNFSYDHNGIVSNQSGHIFYIGQEQTVSDVIEGDYRQLPLQIFVFHYDIGFGKNRRRYNRVVVNVDFGVTLPTFILNRKSIKNLVDNEGDRVKANGYSETLKLEGNFDKHFEVHLPPNTQDGVLMILTPDVMQLLLPLDKYEIEITPSGDFYLYTRKLITKKQDLVEIYKIVELLVNKIASFANIEEKIADMEIRAAQATQVSHSNQPTNQGLPQATAI